MQDMKIDVGLLIEAGRLQDYLRDTRFADIRVFVEVGRDDHKSAFIRIGKIGDEPMYFYRPFLDVE